MTESTFGMRLHEARVARKMSFNELSFHTRSLLPRQRKITGEAIRLYETGAVPEDRVDPIVVAAVAVALDVKLSYLSPLVASDLVVIEEIFSRSTCFGVAA